MIFLHFLTGNTKHCKRLILRWKYVGGINRVIYKKKREKILKLIFFNKKNKENSTAPQKANVMMEICWAISSVVYKKKES